MQYETFPNAQSRLLEQLGPGASMAEAIEAFLEDSRLGSSDLRRARQAITAVIEAEAADFCIEQSLRWMWNELEYEGSYFGDLPTGGYASVIGEMAKGVDVRLATEVSEVQYGSAGVAVRASNGELEWGSHVVVTVPLGVLKQNRPSFSPDLSAERRATIDRLGFGTFEKVALAFERPFWREAGTPHVVVFPADPNEPAIWVLGDDGFGGGPILTALIFRSSAHRVLETTPGDCADWLLALLSEAIVEPCPAPIGIARSSWGTDRFSYGAYSHIRPGACPDDADALGGPVGGRVLFAGEHTQNARLAYADGAMSSGIREAKRLLRTTAVHLG
jgi:polyamine oxidase